MLQIIRSKVTTIFAKILFFLLIASFAVWGIGDVFFGNPAGQSAVEVGDHVRVSAREAAMEFEQARRRIGIPLSPEQAIQLGLLERVMDDMVTRGLITEATMRMGLAAADEPIADAIRDRFRDSLGQFDRTAYQTFLAANGMTEDEFVADLRLSLARQQLVGAVIAGNEAAVPKALVDALHAYRGETRIAEVLLLPAASMPAATAPGDATLTGFFDERKDDYETPEYRSLRWIAITPSTLADPASVSEDELRLAYDERSAGLGKPERRAVDQILFDDEAAARAAYDRLGQGATFEALDDGAFDLGTITRADLPTGTVDAVFSTTAGGVTEPVQSDLGWHLFRVRSIEPGETVAFEDIKDVLRQDLAREAAIDRVFETSNALEDALAGGATLKEAATQTGLSVASIANLDRQGRLKSGDTATGLPGGSFLTSAFGTETGSQSSLQNDSDDGFFVLRVDSVEPPRIPALAEIRERLVADWRRDTQLTAAEDRAESLAKRASEGALLAKIAEDQGLAITQLPPLTRRGGGLPSGFPQGLVAILFDLAPGEVATAADDAGAAVVRLAEVIPAATSGDQADQARAAVRQELENGLEGDVLELLLADLEQEFTVSTNPGSVRRLYEVVSQ
ncbi:MAG: peptidyl-prolyl cis-trans isomerase [Alphaproteobacteria bacterium]|nr:peptidyl-prolyl cis-trans isomerase [Alphaproteobacteria bacterium]